MNISIKSKLWSNLSNYSPNFLLIFKGIIENSNVVLLIIFFDFIIKSIHFWFYFHYFQYPNDQEIHKVNIIIAVISVSLNGFSRFEPAVSMVYNETKLNSTKSIRESCTKVSIRYTFLLKALIWQCQIEFLNACITNIFNYIISIK